MYNDSSCAYNYGNFHYFNFVKRNHLLVYDLWIFKIAHKSLLDSTNLLREIYL